MKIVLFYVIDLHYVFSLYLLCVTPVCLIWNESMSFFSKDSFVAVFVLPYVKRYTWIYAILRNIEALLETLKE